MNESQLREIIKEEIQAVVTEGMLDSVGLQDVEVSEDDYEKFAAAVKAGYGGSIDKEDIPAKWEETIGHPLMKPELKNLTKRLMRDRLVYFGGDFDISEEKLNEGIMDDIQATWDSLNIPGPLVALLDKTEPMNKKVNDWFKKNMGNPVVRMLYKVLMSTDFGMTPDMYRLDKKFEKGELNEDGHTDVPSARRQAKLAIEDSQDILQHLQGFSAEQDLPSWWMKKVSLASAYLNSARDYLLTSGEPMNEMEARSTTPENKAAECKKLEKQYNAANSAVAMNPADVVAIERRRSILEKAKGCAWVNRI